jgi:hypothetical protein
MASSPSTSRDAAMFLRDRAGLPVEALKVLEKKSVESAVMQLSMMQGCHLWKHAGDLKEAVLAAEQNPVLRKSYSNLPSLQDLDNYLRAEQVPHSLPPRKWCGFY